MGTPAPVPFIDNPSASLGPSGTGWDAASSAPAAGQPAAAQPAAATPAAASSPAAAHASGGAQTGKSPTGGSSEASGSPALSVTSGAPASMQPQMPQLPAPVQPVVVTSQQKGGIMGVVDSIAAALTGKTKPEMGTDADGNQYVKQQTMSRGEQWVRIGAGLFGGAARGWAAGQGRNPGAAAAAGFNEGQQQRQQQQQQETQMSDQAMKQNLANANYQKQRMDAAEQAWHLTQMQHEATQHDVQFAQGQEDRLMKVDGATLLGTAADPNDIDKILKVDPNVMENMIKHQQIEILPHFNPDGTRAGIRVFKMPDGYRNTIEPAGSVFHTFDSTTGQYVEHHSSDPLTAGEIDDYETSASNAANKFKLDQANLAQKTAQTNQANATAGKAPSEIARNKGETANAYAQAGKNRAEATKAAADADNAPLVDAIGSGHIAAERMGYLLARNPALVQAVAAKYPGFDASKAESYPQTYKDFTSGKTSVALNSGGTALKHLHELDGLNTPASHIPHTAAWTAYQNKADTVSSELAKFYGDATIPAIASIKNTLTSTLPGNRSSAIQTQAKSMGDKLDSYEQQWKNAAPSASYQAPMPGVDQGAMAARAALDPDYAKRFAAQPQGTQIQPGEPTAKAANGQTLVVRDGAWVPAQQ